MTPGWKHAWEVKDNQDVWHEVAKNLTCTTGKCPKPQWDQKLRFQPNRNNYRLNEELNLTCPGALKPSVPKVKCARQFVRVNSGKPVYEDTWWGRKSTGAWIPIETAVECIETCQRPQWDSSLQLTPDQKNYKKNDEVTLSCPEGFQPSPTFTHVKCSSEDQSFSHGKPKYREVWLGWNMGSAWIPIQSDVECLDILQVVPGTLEISSTSIKLNWTCRLRDACQNMRAMCRLAVPSSPPCEAEEMKGEETLQGQEGTFTCSALQPFTDYSVTISLPPSTILYRQLHRTKETVPDKLEKLWLDPTTGFLMWKPLPSCKGEIIGYQLNITSWRAHDGSSLEFMQVLVNQSVTQYTPSHQAPGSKYLVTVQGLTAAGAGAVSVLEFQSFFSGEPLGPWPGMAVTVVVVLSVLVLLSAGILWAVLSSSWLGSPPGAELQPCGNLDNYCEIKGTLLAVEDAGKDGQAGKPLPQCLPVL
ncbi:uncharacterized protein LOC136001436 [Caloenas nicobarica]|uniref:uncharacterized protein LOC136001436 n=1 Tax=Caloenas nicobarica TaxID=187106 RepID=UPI0032B808F1